MQDLTAQERFEMELLDRLHSARILDKLVFVGGTMLRLCFGLERFSVDLDFWIRKGIDTSQLFARAKQLLAETYVLKDCAEKFHTMLFEVKSANYPRSLKIEIRKHSPEGLPTHEAIAYSPHSTLQVLVRVVSLEGMMKLKAQALADRGEIRDAYDMEFLLRRGVQLNLEKELLRKILKRLNNLTRTDYTVKLGSLLEERLRKYYLTENFRLLKSAIMAELSSSH